MRHQKEMADHMETAAKGKVDATAARRPNWASQRTRVGRGGKGETR